MIERILDLDLTTKQKIDLLLEYDTINYTKLGSDSTKNEVSVVKKESKRVYKAIKSLNEDLGNELLRAL